jgi:hypothetical protein
MQAGVSERESERMWTRVTTRELPQKLSQPPRTLMDAGERQTAKTTSKSAPTDVHERRRPVGMGRRQQHRCGDNHLYAPRSRVLDRFERGTHGSMR